MIKKYSQLKQASEVHEDGFIDTSGRFLRANYKAHYTLAKELISKYNMEDEFFSLIEEQDKIPYGDRDKRVDPIRFLIDKGWIRVTGTLYDRLGLEFSENIDFVKRQLKNLLPEYEGEVIADNLIFDSAGKFKRINFSGEAFEFYRWGGRREYPETHTSSIEDRTFYHVTPTENVESILKNGLIPSIGERSIDFGEDRKRVYLFQSIEDSEASLMGWLGEEFGEEPLSLLEVKLPKEIDFEKEAFEIQVSENIPPECIKVLDDSI